MKSLTDSVSLLACRRIVSSWRKTWHPRATFLIRNWHFAYLKYFPQMFNLNSTSHWNLVSNKAVIKIVLNQWVDAVLLELDLRKRTYKTQKPFVWPILHRHQVRFGIVMATKTSYFLWETWETNEAFLEWKVVAKYNKPKTQTSLIPLYSNAD